VYEVSQLFAFLTVCRNSLDAWIHRELVTDDPWDEQTSDRTSLDLVDLDLPDLQELPKTFPVIEHVSDIPQSSSSDPAVNRLLAN